MKKVFDVIRPLYVIIILLVTLPNNSSADGTWITYTKSNNINDIVVQGDYLWCATKGGVVRWNISDMTYKKYYTNDGLAEHWVSSLAVGPDGSLWAGTSLGLSHLNGETWTTQKANLNYWPSIEIAPNGDIWCNSTYSGVYRFDGKMWTRYTAENGLADNVVYSIAIGIDGNVWIGTENGLNMFNGDIWKTYTTDNGLPDNRIKSIAISHNGNIWCGTWEGISYFDGDVFTTYTTDYIPSYAYVNSMAIDSNGDIWCGTISIGGYGRGVLLFDGEIWTEYTTENGLAENKVTSIAVGPDGDICCGTSGGLSIFNDEKWTNYNTEDWMFDCALTISMGLDGEVWFGTSNGLYRLYNEKWTIYYPPDVWHEENYCLVNTLAIAPDGDIWCGRNGGVNHFDGETWTTHKFYNNEYEVCSLYDVNALAIGPDGDVWCGTDEAIYRFNVNSEIWTNYTVDEGFDHERVKSIAVGPYGDIWFGTYGGVYRFDGKIWTIYTPEDGLGLESKYINGIAVESNGDVWCGTDCVLQRFDGEKWISYFEVDGIAETISIAPDGTLWFLTHGYGVYKFDGEKWTVYTTADGLADNRVESIAFAHNGNIWFGTIRGISRYETLQTFVEKQDFSLSEIAITGNYPNPFNPETTIEYILTNDSTVKIAIYNIIGQKVRTLLSGNVQAGHHSVRWDGKNEDGQNVPTGIYIINLKEGSINVSHYMMLLK